MADQRGRSGSLESESYIEELISSLQCAVGQTWKSVQSSKKHTKEHFSSLLESQAFKRSKFTDTEKYKQGRRTLAFHGAKESQAAEAAHVRHFTDLMGFDRSRSQPHIYLSRELLSGKETKAAFLRFRRRFGEIDQCLFSPKARPQFVPKGRKAESIAMQSKRADTNKYVIRRMGRILQSNSASKGNILLRSASEALACQNGMLSVSPSPMSPKSPQLPSLRASFLSSESIQVIPTFLSIPNI